MPPEDWDFDKNNPDSSGWTPEDNSSFNDQGKKHRLQLRRLMALICLFAFLGLILADLNALLGELPPYLQQFHTISSEEIVKSSRPAVVKITAFSSSPGSESPRQGTGFNIDARGLIITNRHVLDDCQEVRVDFTDGRSFTSNKMKTVGNMDLALVLLNARDLPTLAPDYTRLPTAGELLTIVGDPKGYQGITVQGGLIGYADSDVSSVGLMVVHASIGPGSSGSPVIDRQGKVVGVVFAMTGQGQNSMALAIPLAGLSNQLKWATL